MENPNEAMSAAELHDTWVGRKVKVKGESGWVVTGATLNPEPKLMVIRDAEHNPGSGTLVPLAEIEQDK